MSPDEMVSLITELYDARKDAREYLDYWADPNPEKASEHYELLIMRVYFTPSGVARKSPSASEVKTLLKHFATLVFDPEREASLMVRHCEIDFIWLQQREWRALSHISTLRKYIEDTRAYIDTSLPTDISDTHDGLILRLDRLSELLDDFEENPPERHYRRRRWW